MKIEVLKKLAKVYFNAKLTPLLVGGHGIGKTETVRQIAKEQGFDRVLEIKLGNLNDSADLLGLFEFKDTPDGKRTVYARPDFWPKKGEKVLVFFDELNRCARSLVQPVMEIALEFKHHDYYLPEGCRVIAAMNPDTEYYQVESFDDNAYISRFCQIAVEPSLDEWRDYVKANNKINSLQEKAINFFTKKKSFIDPNYKAFEVVNKPDRRKVTKLIVDVIPQQLDENSLFLVAQSMIGVEASTALIKELKRAKPNVSGLNIIKTWKDNETQETFNRLIIEHEIDTLTSITEEIIEFFNKPENTIESVSNKNNLCDFFTRLPLEIFQIFTNKMQEAEHSSNRLLELGYEETIINHILSNFTGGTEKSGDNAGTP